MTEREEVIRGICGLGQLETLAADIVVSDMTIEDACHLVTCVLAWLDVAPDSGGAMPDMAPMAHLPAPVRAKARALVADAVAAAIAHRTPTGRPS